MPIELQINKTCYHRDGALQSFDERNGRDNFEREAMTGTIDVEGYSYQDIPHDGGPNKNKAVCGKLLDKISKNAAVQKWLRFNATMDGIPSQLLINLQTLFIQNNLNFTVSDLKIHIFRSRSAEETINIIVKCPISDVLIMPSDDNPDFITINKKANENDEDENQKVGSVASYQAHISVKVHSEHKFVPTLVSEQFASYDARLDKLVKTFAEREAAYDCLYRLYHAINKVDDALLSRPSTLFFASYNENLVHLEIKSTLEAIRDTLDKKDLGNDEVISYMQMGRSLIALIYDSSARHLVASSQGERETQRRFAIRDRIRTVVSPFEGEFKVHATSSMAPPSDCKQEARGDNSALDAPDYAQMKCTI